MQQEMVLIEILVQAKLGDQKVYAHIQYVVIGLGIFVFLDQRFIEKRFQKGGWD